MDNLILPMYKKYGKMVNQNRMIPLDLDGLKPVERRLLLSTYQIAKDKFIKSARIDGHCMGNFHPHSSSYNTLVQLYHQGFIDGEGNFGNDYSIEPSPPAAMRYTECKLKKETEKLSFMLLDYVPWVISEVQDPDIMEPEYLPTMYPLCLISKKTTDGIAFGYRTVIPSYTKEDLYKRLLFLLGKNKDNPIIKPLTDCELTSTKEEFESLLKTGKGKISFKGIFKHDPTKSRLIIKALPPGKSFTSVLKSFKTELENQDIGWMDESSKLNNNGTHIVFDVIKQRNRDLIFKSMVEKMDSVLRTTVSFKMLLVDYETKNTKLMSVDEMLLKTYNMFKSINGKMLKSEYDRYDETIKENNLIFSIRPFLSKELATKETNVDIISENISKEMKIEKSVIKKVLQKHTISKLISSNIDNEKLYTIIKAIENNINNLDHFTLTQYK